jgi:hypothetical protein
VGLVLMVVCLEQPNDLAILDALLDLHEHPSGQCGLEDKQEKTPDKAEGSLLTCPYCRLGQLAPSIDRWLGARLGPEHHAQRLEQILQVLLVLGRETLKARPDVGKVCPRGDVLLDPHDNLFDAVELADLIDNKLQSN